MKRTGLGMAAVLATVFAGSAHAQLPDVELPPLPVPTPSLPAPTLPAPELPAPSLPSPSLPAPSLPAPELPVPSPTSPLPAPSAPAPSGTDQAPSGGADTAPPGTSQAPAPGARQGSGGGATGGRDSGAPDGGPAARSVPGTRRGAAGAAARGPAEGRAQRRDRRLRVAVRRFGGCLSSLPRRQRRVLRLRAGIGPAEPASRTRVADRLELSLRQVRRAERRGLRTLRRIGTRGCVEVDHGDAGSPAFAVMPPDAGHLAPGRPAGGTEARSGGVSGGGGGAGASGAAGVRGAADTRPAPPKLPGAAPDGSGELVLLALLGLVVALSLVITRRRPGTPG